MIHDFKESLKRSQAQASAPWWEDVYREMWPSFAGMTYVGDSPAQRDGVDRLITTTSGHVYRVDEKSVSKDWGDFFLEFWSDRDRKKPGWVAKDLACDFIAYAFVPSQRCYLLPFPTLRRAWKLNRYAWVAQYGERIVPNKGWVTVGCPVPIKIVLQAVAGSTLIRWGEGTEDPKPPPPIIRRLKVALTQLPLFGPKEPR